MRANFGRRGGMALALAAGLGLGWITAGGRPTSIQAAVDRMGERAVTTGMILRTRNKQGDVLATQEAVYVLNYGNGLLLAAVPAYRQAAGTTRVLSEFAERDLVKDFGIAPGARPHFLMSTMELGLLGDDWAALVVVETESGTVAAYRALPLTTASSTRPALQLVELRTDPRLARSMAAAMAEPGR